MLATFKPDHVFFSKDYLPPQRIIKREEMVIDNSDNFFSGLPKISKSRDLKRKARLMTFRDSNEEKHIKTLKVKKAQLE